jgi:hypothetical protein
MVPRTISFTYGLYLVACRGTMSISSFCIFLAFFLCVFFVAIGVASSKPVLVAMYFETPIVSLGSYMNELVPLVSFTTESF